MPADTIVAIATAPGTGGIGVVRLSGPAAVAIAQTLTPETDFSTLSPRVLTRAALTLADGVKDDALVVVMPAPNSYTGEDVVELHAHGSPVILDAAVRAAAQAGARVADPGEFTQRAFRNGRMDLAQAEAVADLINARTTTAARCAGRQLSGGLSERIEGMRDACMHVLAEMEAGLDFSEDELELPAHAEYRERLQPIAGEIQALLKTTRTGDLVQHGATVVLVGRPNAGKSSLFNALLQRERAIVTAEPGTTRDTIEGEIDLDGVPLRLVDTAGVREAGSEAEAHGVERSRAAAADADIILRVIDRSVPWDGEGDDVGADQAARTILLYNKCDLPAVAERRDGNVSASLDVSAATGAGLDLLHEALRAQLNLNGALDGESPVIARARHAAALEDAAAALVRADDALDANTTLDCVAIDLRAAMDSLGSIVGVRTTDDLLNHIFGQFCIGK